ncbi:MAG: 4-(cytidine 5'-diphospho)-2-C-methyl-D-erythritol kinase [Ruminococcaceae bacterium]|nr:4-(cytidine 5'-diphospho)-2-C-methyl-D-erythritol kinase [Oscillospiraceae bacterium]
MSDTVTLPAYAKINLFLDITGTLPNGYHSLNNVMQQIALHDDVTVSFEEAAETVIEIACDDPQIPCNEKNIAHKAAKLFLSNTGTAGKVKVEIKKSIPVMAGLGGSSTDGAAVLVGLNRLCGKPFSQRSLEEMGAALGADVPFCIRGNCAYCKGIGEQMTDIRGIENCSLLIVKPDFSNNTALAYGQYDKNPIKARPEPEKLLNALKNGNLTEAAGELYNIFELLDNVQAMEEIKQALTNAGALGAALSGSGSAVYGIFSERKTALSAADKLDYPVRIVTEPVNADKADKTNLSITLEKF